MRVVTVSRILNEDDIVEAFVRHNATFVDHMMFLDNGSTDCTLDILRRLQTEGLPLSVFQTHSVSFDETAVNTWLYATADRMHRPAWIAFLDVDEFISCDDNRLAITLGRRPTAGPALMVRLVHYFDTAEDDNSDQLVPRRMRWRLKDDLDIFKVIVRGGIGGVVSIDAGNHGGTLAGTPFPHLPEPRIELAHYPRRSGWHGLQKTVVGWLKVLAAGEEAVQRGYSQHYRSEFETLRERSGTLLRNPDYFAQPVNHETMKAEPLDYRGSPLRYTEAVDPMLRAVRNGLCYAEMLARRHGALLDHATGARELVERWNAERKFLF